MGKSRYEATKVPVSLKFAIGGAIFGRGRGGGGGWGRLMSHVTCGIRSLSLPLGIDGSIGARDWEVLVQRGRVGAPSAKDFGIQPKPTVTDPLRGQPRISRRGGGGRSGACREDLQNQRFSRMVGR
jgi:hypothetical protein